MPTAHRLLLILALLLPLAGCDTGPDAAGRDPGEPPGPRDTQEAHRLNREAVAAIEAGRWDEAQTLLREALEADRLFGPAHNSLGKVHFHHQRLYQAAWRFQYAAELMPHRPEPRSNLGLVYEAAGQLEQAAGHYAQAMEEAPDNPEFIGNLARVRVRQGRRGPELRQLLEQLVMKDTRPAWRQWARRELALHRASSPDAAGDWVEPPPDAPEQPAPPIGSDPAPDTPSNDTGTSTGPAPPEDAP